MESGCISSVQEAQISETTLGVSPQMNGCDVEVEAETVATLKSGKGFGVCSVESGSCSPETPPAVSPKMNGCDVEVEPVTVAPLKSGKSGGSRENGHSSLNGVNKSNVQIKKPPHRKSVSPINWFPRKKTETFLKKKIRLLQEGGGMKSSLDETLYDSNPHYSRVLREKIATRKAASKAMEARKAAMVEASWCRILRAARIQSKEAEAELVRAESFVEEAFQEAAALGVILYDRPDFPRRPCEIESSSVIGGGSTHKVSASFETEFEVDKEVTAAVRTAFIRLASCASEKKDFKDLLQKISQNPVMKETECVPDSGAEITQELQVSGFALSDAVETKGTNMRRRKGEEDELSHGAGKFLDSKLVVVMHERLKCLKEDELSSLATIVATCGLNAALHKENGKQYNPYSFTGRSGDPLTTLGRSTLRRKTSITEAAEIPSLDKFLVKHYSKLEKEVLEARNSSKSLDGESRLVNSKHDTGLTGSNCDFGCALVKDDLHSDSGGDGKENVTANTLMLLSIHCGDSQKLKESTNISSSQVVDGKYISRIEKAKLEALEAFNMCSQGGKTNVENSLESILLKPVHRLEREKMQASKLGRSTLNQRDRHKKQNTVSGECEGLDKVLVKHVSRLEKEKMEAAHTNEEFARVRKDQQKEEKVGESLDDVLVKHQSRLEKEKMAAATATEEFARVSKVQQKEEKVGESLDDVLVKHQSRLEKEKMAAATATEEIVRVRNRDQQREKTDESLENILVKHQSRLEKEKMASGQQLLLHVKSSDARREAREKELQEAWGGLSLGNSIKPHLSRLERDRAAWRRAEEEEQRHTRAV
ncbi:hypothetical protein QJS10_CPA02g00316 [Acorus calamus]|uniref:Uncharacterized protein n=1 Tax=Acorus calamus TaxID=4465 RepID=A0AAV9FC57_ACOCL|nr:hypothetical protein QJS10_CPA02g00316 [Acorus calamus]